MHYPKIEVESPFGGTTWREMTEEEYSNQLDWYRNYMMKNQKPFIMALIPGMFYMYIVTCFILNEKIGFGININICYIISSILTLLYGFQYYILENRKERIFVQSKKIKGMLINPD